MRRSSTRRAGAFLLLAVFLTGCTESAPTSPSMVPDGPVETRIEKSKDGEGRSHEVRVDTRGGYITRVNHDVDGRPLARLVYHYRAAPGGAYVLARVSGRITAAGRSVDVGPVWPQVQAAASARGMRLDILPVVPDASASLRRGCWFEVGELAFWSAALAYVLTMAPFSWPSFYGTVAAYIHAMHEYDECSGGTY